MRNYVKQASQNGGGGSNQQHHSCKEGYFKCMYVCLRRGGVKNWS